MVVTSIALGKQSPMFAAFRRFYQCHDDPGQGDEPASSCVRWKSSSSGHLAAARGRRPVAGRRRRERSAQSCRTGEHVTPRQRHLPEMTLLSSEPAADLGSGQCTKLCLAAVCILLLHHVIMVPNLCSLLPDDTVCHRAIQRWCSSCWRMTAGRSPWPTRRAVWLWTAQQLAALPRRCCRQQPHSSRLPRPPAEEQHRDHPSQAAITTLSIYPCSTAPTKLRLDTIPGPILPWDAQQRHQITP
jgi:hypothetical protein